MCTDWGKSVQKSSIPASTCSWQILYSRDLVSRAFRLIFLGATSRDAELTVAALPKSSCPTESVIVSTRDETVAPSRRFFLFTTRFG